MAELESLPLRRESNGCLALFAMGFILFVGGAMWLNMGRPPVLAAEPKTTPLTAPLPEDTPSPIVETLAEKCWLEDTLDPEQVDWIQLGEAVLHVKQQPLGQPDEVTKDEKEVTQFQLATRLGVTGILAHNYLEGNRFFNLQEGDKISACKGGRIQTWEVVDTHSFQALDPTNTFSQFVDLGEPFTNRVLTAGELFQRMYTQAGQLVLQTCIDANGEPSWGRMFKEAKPVEE